MNEQENTIQLPANLLRAAAIFRAKSDVRYYLNGIHINPAGYIEASDGHTGFRAECEEATALSEPLILDIDGDIPKSACTVELVRMGEREGYLRLVTASDKPVESKGFPVRRWVRLVDGKFPDLGRVMESHKPAPVSRVSFNTSYLVRLDKAAAAMGCARYPVATFDLGGEGGPAAATISGEGCTAKVLIMSCRL